MSRLFVSPSKVCMALLMELALCCTATLRTLAPEQRSWCSCSHIREILGASSAGLVVVVRRSLSFGDVSCLHAESSLVLGETRGPLGKATAYVVFLDDGGGNLEPLLESMRTADHWNSRARFVACHRESRLDVDALVRWKVHNAVLLRCSKPRQLVVPRLYRDISSCRRVTWSSIQPRRTLEDAVLFPNERVRNLRGCQVRVSVLEEPPYVVQTPGGAFDGLDVTMARTALQWLNADPRFAATDPRYGAGWFENGTWNGILGDLVDDRIDVGASGFVLVRERLLAVDAVYPHAQDCLVWVVPRARRLPPWRSLLRAFSGNVWLASGAAGCAATLVLSLLDGWYRGVTAACSPSPPRRSPRALVLAVLGAVLLASLYRSALLATLLDPGREPQVETLDAARDAGLRLAYQPVIEYFLQDDPSIGLDRELAITPVELYDLVARRGHITLSGRLEAHYYQNYLLRDQIFIFTYNFVSYDTCLYVGKGHALLEPLTKVVLRVLAAGLLPKWESDLSRKAWLRTTAAAVSQDSVLVLRVRHLQGAFALLGVGVAVATVALFLEVCVAKRR